MEIFKTDLQKCEKTQAGMRDLWVHAINLHLNTEPLQESDLKKRLLQRIDAIVKTEPSDQIES